MKYWENVVCSHEDGFHSDCFGCGFKFCKEHSFFAKEKDDAVASAVEAREREISEAVNEMKSSFEKAGIKKQWEVTDEDRSSGSYNYIESGFLGGYQTAKQDILSIINPSKE